MAIILVVDDEVGIRELLSEILIDEGYDVRLAENAQAARKARQEMRPDLVLLDIWMPDTDGISLLKEWHSSGQLSMPVVMMSGHGTIDTAVEATRFGACDFLEKPVSLQKLLGTVQKALKFDAPQAVHHSHWMPSPASLSSRNSAGVWNRPPAGRRSFSCAAPPATLPNLPRAPCMSPAHRGSTWPA